MNSTTKQSLRDILKNARRTVVTSTKDDVENLHIVLGGNEEEHAKGVEDARKLALSNGAILTEPDGSKRWRTSEIVHDASDGLRGGQRYEWHADGERCRWERIEYTEKDGARSRRVLRRMWRMFE